MKETLESSRAKDDAISQALEGIPDIGADWTPPGQEEIKSASDTTDGDGHSESASTLSSPPDAKAEKPPVTRPVEGPKDGEAAKAAPTYDAPKNWSEDRRKVFAQLPGEAQKLILEREKEDRAGFEKYSQQTAPARQLAESVSKVFDPYRNELQQSGMDIPSAIQHIIREREQFNRDPFGFLAPIAARMGNGDPAPFVKALIEKTGLTREKLFGGTTVTQPAEDSNLWVDPGVLQLKQQFEQTLTPLQQKLQQLEHAQFLRQQQEQQARQQWEFAQRQQHEQQLQSIENDLVGLLGSADDAGNPKYPEFDDIQDELIELLETPRFKAMPVSPDKFDKAYRQVMRGRDDYFDKQVEAAAAKRAAEANQQKAVQKAAAAATRKPGPGSNGQIKAGPMSANAAIAKAFEELGIA